jgi:hypothetical protein
MTTFRRSIQLSALYYLDFFSGLIARTCLRLLNLFDDVVPFKDFAEDDVAVIKPTR